MIEAEARELTFRIRSTWTGSFMDDEMISHWTEFLQGYSLEDAVRAFAILQRTSRKIPSQPDFVDAIEGEASQRFKCPTCGIGWRTQERMEEHVANVHW